MTKHTPGNWGVINQKESSSMPHRLIAICGDGYEVVTAESGNLVFHEAAEGNARLLASAPELLEALSELLDCCNNSTARVIERGFMTSTADMNAATRKARSAIAKAKGEL